MNGDKSNRRLPNPNEAKSVAASNAWRRLQLARAKLKTSTKNAALLAGFAMIPLVEMEVSSFFYFLKVFSHSESPQISDCHQNPVPLPLLITFGVVTTLLVAVHLSALMIASCILPHIDAVALSEERDIESINDSPHDKMVFFIEISWIFSNIIGIVLFLSEIGLLTWVKFWQIGDSCSSGEEIHNEKGDETTTEDPDNEHMDNRGKKVAYASSGVLVLSIIFFIWYAIYFYRELAEHEIQRSRQKVQKLEQEFTTRRKFSVWAKSAVLKKSSMPKSSTKSMHLSKIEEMPSDRIRTHSISFKDRY